MADSQKKLIILPDNPLCGISTYKDTLNLATGVCTRQIKKLVLTGNESGWTMGTSNVGKRFGYRILDAVESNTSKVNSILSHLPLTVSGGTNDYPNTYAIGSDLTLLIVLDSTYTSLNQFLDWIRGQYNNGTPVTLWYRTATPTTETIAVPSGLSGTEEGYLTQSGTPTPTNPVYPTANEVLIWQHSLRKLTTATEAVENPLYSDGTAITAYTLKGNEEHTGTPTPSNPVDVNGVGERTENLFDGQLQQGYYAYATGDYTLGDNYVCTHLIPCTENTTYTFRCINASGGSKNYGYVFFDSAQNRIGSDYINELTEGDVVTYTATTPQNTAFLAINVAYGRRVIYVHPSDITDFMLNTGSTPKPYEPYGYKIPISSGQQTTNIYLGSIQTVREIGCIDMSEYNFTYIPQFRIWECTTIPNVKYASSSTELGNALAEKYINHTASGLYAAVNNFAISTSSVSVNTGSDSISPSGKLYYALATPETATVNEPLMKIGDYADTLSNATAISTTEGANSITVDTTVQPSEFTATWTGWHNASVKEKSENLFNTFDIVGQVPSISNGQLINYNGSTTSLIPIISGNITVTKPPTALLYLLLYAADMSYIGYVQNSTDANFYGSSVTGYENARFARLRIDRTTGLDDIQIMLNTGSTALPYEPYWK